VKHTFAEPKKISRRETPTLLGYDPRRHWDLWHFGAWVSWGWQKAQARLNALRPVRGKNKIPTAVEIRRSASVHRSEVPYEGILSPRRRPRAIALAKQIMPEGGKACSRGGAFASPGCAV